MNKNTLEAEWLKKHTTYVSLYLRYFGLSFNSQFMKNNFNLALVILIIPIQIYTIIIGLITNVLEQFFFQGAFYGKIVKTPMVSNSMPVPCGENSLFCKSDFLLQSYGSRKGTSLECKRTDTNYNRLLRNHQTIELNAESWEVMYLNSGSISLISSEKEVAPWEDLIP